MPNPVYFRRYECFKITINGVNNCITLGNLISLPILLKHGWKILSVKESSLRINGGNDTVITCRTDSGFDVGHIREIFLQGAYHTSFEQKNVIDIGMSNGDSSIYFAKAGAKKVVGIEPTKESFDLAMENIKDSKVQGTVVALNKAMGIKNGVTDFFMSGYSPNGNSLDKANMVDLTGRMEFKRTVETITLESVFKLLNGELCHLMKMDCEGCEYSVLGLISHDLYDKIEEIQLEYHNGLQTLPYILTNAGYHLSIRKGNRKMGYIVASKKLILEQQFDPLVTLKCL
ncbi:MAG: FkbM family methyltransferase [Thermoplasmataceae archaeon]